MNTLPRAFVDSYNYEEDIIQIALFINNAWLPLNGMIWKDLGYMSMCCKEGGMYAISFPPRSISHIRVSGVGEQDIILSQRQLRALSRDYQVRMGYLAYH